MSKKTQTEIKLKARPDGKRRYKKGEAPVYDKEYDDKLSESWILNKAIRKNNLDTAFRLSGYAECKQTLMTLVGIPEKGGRYKDLTSGINNQWRMADVPAAKNALERVYRKYKIWQKKQVESGNYLQEPDFWPDDLRRECLKAQAKLDLRRREKSYVQHLVEKFARQKGKPEAPKVKEPMLPWGPVTHFTQVSTSGDKLKSIDGQNVSYSPLGRPYIDHPKSPYHLMPLATYKQMSKQWKRENRIFDIDLVKRAKRYKQKLIELELKRPGMFGRRNFTAMIKGQSTYKGQEDWPEFTPWPDNPDWPSDAKTIKEIEQDAVAADS